MKNQFAKVLYVTAFILLIVCGTSIYSVAEDSGSNKELPEGVYLKLNREFYETLRDDKTTYSNSKSTEYLREISVSSRFIVETNLQIIKQQEEIIRLLEEIADKKK